jgi:hypothetical protein
MLQVQSKPYGGVRHGPRSAPCEFPLGENSFLGVESPAHPGFIFIREVEDATDDDGIAQSKS